MSADFSITTFYSELQSLLPACYAAERKVWAATIIEKDLDIKELSKLLICEPKIATRFLWLLSEIGEMDPNKLFTELPFLLKMCDRLDPKYKTSFAMFWLLAGVPPENEAKAIDMLFQWVLSSSENVTIKSRSFLVLFQLTKKYPELKNELKLCLKEEMDKHTSDFKKRAVKLLLKIEP